MACRCKYRETREKWLVPRKHHTPHPFKISLTRAQIIECVRLLLQVPIRIKREAARYEHLKEPPEGV